MRIETNAQTSEGAEVGGSTHQSLTADTRTLNGDQEQSSPERQWSNRLAQAGQLPETRSERIAAIQAAIANGTYQVSAEQTAEAILAEHLVRDESAA